MRITILTVGSRGDVQPFVALGRGLQRVGHCVRIATHAVFEGFVTGQGLDFAPVGMDPHALMRQIIPAWQKASRHPIRFLRSTTQLILPQAKAYLADAWQACLGSEAILFSPLGNAGYHIAERLRIPCFQAMIQPLSPTRMFASPLVSPGIRLGGGFNRLTHLLNEQIGWLLSRRLVNAWRRKLGLHPLRRSPQACMRRQGVPELHGYSPSVLPRARDWPRSVHVTGFWSLDLQSGWQPPASLQAFVEAGPPPVSVGFGTIFGHDPRALTRLVVDALTQTRTRAILGTALGGLQATDLPDTVYPITDVPHDWLFPRVAAVVHHGGVGTMAVAFRVGVPQVSVPFFYDHPFWADRAVQLGVGVVAAPSMRRLTSDRLAKALRQATDDARMRTRALELAAQVRLEDGVGHAVHIIEEMLRQYVQPNGHRSVRERMAAEA